MTTQNEPLETELFSNSGWELIQRMATAFSKSTLVPKAYIGNVPNCIIALNMAKLIGADPLQTMQNLYVVHGNPTWSSQFLISTFNTCGRFSSIRYEFTGDENKDSWGCRAVATELETGEVISGTLVTIAMAKKEGWYSKSGSKWQTMPEQMLRYRSAAWLVRAYAPELGMGLQTAEEARDTVDGKVISSNASRSETLLASLTTDEKPTKKQDDATPPEQSMIDEYLTKLSTASTVDEVATLFAEYQGKTTDEDLFMQMDEAAAARKKVLSDV